MPLICYVPKTFSPVQARVVQQVNAIISRYVAMGYNLTLRQIYYQMVAQDLFPEDRKWSWTGSRWTRDPNGTKNAQPNYDWLGDIVSEARMAGLVDWNHVVDRTRELARNAHWKKAADVVKDSALTFAVDKWADQENYVEVWVEKDALEDVVGRACSRLDVPYFSCRGYTSQSSMWGAAQRLLEKMKEGRTPHIIHLGDHDPSGIHMSSDIKARLGLFCGAPVHVLRIALNWPQVQRYNPPPNPAKLADPRAKDYVAKHGLESWELDALDPRVIDQLIERAVLMHRNEAKWKASVERQERGRRKLQAIVRRWKEVVDFLKEKEED